MCFSEDYPVYKGWTIQKLLLNIQKNRLNTHDNASSESVFILKNLKILISTF